MLLAGTVLLVSISLLLDGCGGQQTGPANSWQLVSTPSSATQINYFAIKSSNNHWFVADRLSGFWISTNQGTSWSQINAGMPNLNGWTIQVNPANGDLIASLYKGSAGVPGDFYRSSNEGTSWTKIPFAYGFTAPAYSGCIFPSSTIVCGGFWAPNVTVNTGVWVSINSGVSTTQGIDSRTNDAVQGLATNPTDGSLFMGTEQHGIFRSTDGGFHWTQVSPDNTTFDPVNGIEDGNAGWFAFDRSGNILVSTQGGVWKSSGTAGVYAWTNILSNRNSADGKAMGQDAHGNLYYGHRHDTTNLTSVYRSINDGASWQAFDNGIPTGLEAHEFLISPIDNKMYSVIEDGGTNHGWVYRTVNAVQ